MGWLFPRPPGLVTPWPFRATRMALLLCEMLGISCSGGDTEYPSQVAPAQQADAASRRCRSRRNSGGREAVEEWQMANGKDARPIFALTAVST